MKVIKVLGSGCANCKNTAHLIEDVAKSLNCPVEILKVEDYAEIAKYQVMRTPAVVINEQVVHSGGIPARDTVMAWFQTEGASACCSESNNSRENCCG